MWMTSKGITNNTSQTVYIQGKTKWLQRWNIFEMLIRLKGLKKKSHI